jgi:hypothetical protein
MKKRMMEMAMLTAASALVIGVSSCKTGMGGVETTDVVAMKDGVMIVDTITMSATVAAKDAVKRKLTLQSNDTGEKKTFKATPEMVNFDQVNVGDQVQAVVTEDVAVYIGAGAPPSAASAGSVMVSPGGTKPAGVVSVTRQVTAVVTAIDAKKHKVTLKLPDGTTKNVKVDKDMDLSAVNIGESVTVVVGEGLAISVTTP